LDEVDEILGSNDTLANVVTPSKGLVKEKEETVGILKKPIKVAKSDKTIVKY